MYYVLDEKGNRVESFDKQGFLAFLQEAINNGDLTGIDGDSAFVSKLKCCVGGQTYKMAFVTQAVYNQLKEDKKIAVGTLYFITDDNSYNDIVDALNAIFNGSESVGNATNATNATKVNGIKFEEDKNGVLKVGECIIEKVKPLLQEVTIVDASAGETYIQLSENFNDNDIIRIVNNTTGQVFELLAQDGEYILATEITRFSNFSIYIANADITYNKGENRLYFTIYTNDTSVSKLMCIRQIYRVIR